MDFEELKDPELQKRLESVRTPEELLEIVQKEGFDLSDEEMKGISGGDSWEWDGDCDNYTCNSMRVSSL